MKKLTLTEKFTLEVGTPVATERAKQYCEWVEAALRSMRIDFDTRERRDVVLFKEYIFLVDIREAAVVADIFDRMDNKLT